MRAGLGLANFVEPPSSKARGPVSGSHNGPPSGFTAGDGRRISGATRRRSSPLRGEGNNRYQHLCEPIPFPALPSAGEGKNVAPTSNELSTASDIPVPGESRSRWQAAPAQRNGTASPETTARFRDIYRLIFPQPARKIDPLPLSRSCCIVRVQLFEG